MAETPLLWAQVEHTTLIDSERIAPRARTQFSFAKREERSLIHCEPKTHRPCPKTTNHLDNQGSCMPQSPIRLWDLNALLRVWLRTHEPPEASIGCMSHPPNLGRDMSNPYELYKVLMARLRPGLQRAMACDALMADQSQSA